MKTMGSTVAGQRLSHRAKVVIRPHGHGWRLTALVMGCATLLALIDAGPTYLGHITEGHPRTWAETVRITLALWLSLGLVTLPVFWLARPLRLDTVDARTRIRHLILHVVAAIGFAFAHLVLYVRSVALLVTIQAGFLSVLSTHIEWLFTVDFLIYWAILGAYYAFHYYQVATEQDNVALQLRANLMEARLQTLQTQLNPHFFFNTLNAVSVLAMKGELSAVTSLLAQLSDLLRASLDDKRPQEVTLAKELEFIDGYLEIQRIRFGERLQVKRHVAPDALNVLVPSLVLQPIVENAIVHGISRQVGDGRISIEATRENGHLRLNVSDTGPGFGSLINPVRRGIGLTNTQERLACLYGPGQWIEYANGDAGGAVVTIFIPVQPHNRSAVEPLM